MCVSVNSSCTKVQLFLIWNWLVLRETSGHKVRTVAFLAELKISLALLYRYRLLNSRHYEAEAFLPVVHCNVKISADCHAYERQQGLFLAKPV